MQDHDWHIEELDQLGAGAGEVTPGWTVERGELVLDGAQARALLDRCAPAFAAFQQARAGLVVAPAGAWAALAAIAGEVERLPDLASGAAQVTADEPTGGVACAARARVPGSAETLLSVRWPADGLVADTASFVLDDAMNLIGADWLAAGDERRQAAVSITRPAEGWIVAYPTDGFSRYAVNPLGAAEAVGAAALAAQPALSLRDYLTRLGGGSFYEPPPEAPTDDTPGQAAATPSPDTMLQQALDHLGAECQQLDAELPRLLRSLADQAGRFRQAQAEAARWRQRRPPPSATPTPTMPAVMPIPVATPGTTPPTACPICQAPLRAGAKFCGTCGHRFAPPEPVRCAGCGATLEPGQRFCTECGRVVIAPGDVPGVPSSAVAPPVARAMTCPTCAAAVPAGRKFCVRCGTPVGVPALAPTPSATVCPACGATLNRATRFCTVCGAVTASATPRAATAPPVGERPWPAPPPIAWTPSPPPVEVAPPPPPPPQPVTVGGAARRAPASPAPTPGPPAGSAPAPGSLHAIEDRLTDVAAQAVASLNQAGLSTNAGFGRLLARLIRAALLDRTVYHDLGADRAPVTDAWVVAALVLVAGSAGLLFSTLTTFSMYGLTALVTTVLLQIVALVVRVWVVQVAAATWLKRSVAYSDLFRALAYALAPVALLGLPVVGQAIGLWSLVTSTIAVREATGTTTLPAAVLAVISIVGAMLAVGLASPLLLPLIRFY